MHPTLEHALLVSVGLTLASGATGATGAAHPRPQQSWSTPSGEVDLAQPAAAEADSFAAIERDFERGAQPGLIAGVVRGGELEWSLATGRADLASGAAMTAATMLPLASVSKSFTGFATALLEARGELNLDLPLAHYVPEAEWIGPRVPVRTLVHHTSGVEDAAGILALAGWRLEDLPSRADVVRALCAQQHLRWPAGEREAYGNGGYVLLAEIVARVGGMDFADWMQAQVFAPLGMQRTTFDPARGPQDDRARTYSAVDGGWSEARYGEFQGAGGLYSCLEDLARWGAQLSAPQVGDAALLEAYRRPGHLSNGSELDYAFGLSRSVERGVELYQHAGGAPGISSRAVWIPDQDLFVFAAANFAGERSVPSQLVTRVLDLLLADVREPPVAPDGAGGGGPRMVFIPAHPERPAESFGIEADPELVAAAQGSYRMQDGELFVFRASEAKLSIALDGQPPYFEIFPLGEGRFVFSPMGWQFVFEPDDAGQVQAVTRIVPAGAFGSSGAEELSVGERVEPPRVDAQLAQSCVGLWYSDEVQSVFELEFDGSELFVSHARLAPMPLIPVEAGVFAIESGPLAQVDLVLDAEGEVEALEIEARSWGARARFTRL